MISIEKEIMIRSMLTSGGTSKVRISREIGVSIDTVYKISKLSALRKRKPIRASTGFHEMPKIRGGSRRCSSCGAFVEVWPCLACHPSGGMPDRTHLISEPRIINATKALKSSISGLIHISQDILSLSEMGIECFNNPLFRALAGRASKVLRKINVKKGEFVNAKID